MNKLRYDCFERWYILLGECLSGGEFPGRRIAGVMAPHEAAIGGLLGATHFGKLDLLYGY